MPESLYLDAIATTRISEPVREQMRPYLDTAYGLPTGAHSLALDARDAVEAARASVLSFADAPARSSCIFTGSGTEANNLGLLGAMRRRGSSARVITSSIEHPSVAGACQALEREGFQIIRLPVDHLGMLAVDDVKEVIQAGDLLVTHLANYDIGTKQSLVELGALSHEMQSTFMVDATHGAGWNELSMSRCGADLVTLAPHRFFGPAGVGVLLVRPGVEIDPIYFGGMQESGLRPGSSSVALLVGAGAACGEAAKLQSLWQEQTAALQVEFTRQLSEKLTEFQINGPAPGMLRDPHHLSLSIGYVEGEAILLNLDLRGIQLTSQTGCVTASDKVSPVLRAIGVDQELALGTLVIGLLPEQTTADVARVVDAMVSAVGRVREMSQAWHQRGA